MSSFLRFIPSRPADGAAAPTPDAASLAAETDAVRHIVARLEALPPDKARLLAGMAYVLARAAYADLEISDAETVAMEAELTASGLDPSAGGSSSPRWPSSRRRPTGGTSDYLVTREFLEHSTPEQRLMAPAGLLPGLRWPTTRSAARRSLDARRDRERAGASTATSSRRSGPSSRTSSPPASGSGTGRRAAAGPRTRTGRPNGARVARRRAAASPPPRCRTRSPSCP